MPFVFDPDDRAAIAAAFDEVIPGCVELGALDYLEELLGALDHDPPHIWAAPRDHQDEWLELGVWEHHAWARRIEDWKATYARVAEGDATTEDRRTLYEHACQATYADPAYGGNHHGEAWRRIEFPEPMFPPKRPVSAEEAR